VSKTTCNLPITSFDQSVWSTFKDLELANSSFHQLNKIDILLNCDVMFAMIKIGKNQCGNVIAQNTTFGWVIGGRAQVSPAQPTITTFHNIVDIDQQLQRFWELEEMFLTAEEAACEQHVIEKRDTSVSIIVAIIEKTTFFKQYSVLTRLQRTAAYCLRLFRNAKNFVASDKKQLQHIHDAEKLHKHLATNGISWHFVPSAQNFGVVWEAVVTSMKVQLRNAALPFK
jgi:hypothetical protein